jgi:hypothetical protein
MIYGETWKKEELYKSLSKELAYNRSCKDELRRSRFVKESQRWNHRPRI